MPVKRLELCVLINNILQIRHRLFERHGGRMAEPACRASAAPAKLSPSHTWRVRNPAVAALVGSRIRLQTCSEQTLSSCFNFPCVFSSFSDGDALRRELSEPSEWRLCFPAGGASEDTRPRRPAAPPAPAFNLNVILPPTQALTGCSVSQASQASCFIFHNTVKQNLGNSFSSQ